MAFQEMDAIPMISSLNVKSATRPPHPHLVPKFIKDAYRTAMFGRPGPAFVDLPANLIMGHFDVELPNYMPYIEAPKAVAPDTKIKEVVKALRTAKAPLVVLGKGAAYGRSERVIRELIEK